MNSSPTPPPAPDPPPAFQELWSSDLKAVAQPTSWLWHGFLAPGYTTLLTSQWKSGKTTLAAVLLSKLQTGGTLAGRAVAAGKAAVVSEEGAALWQQRGQKFAWGNHVCWFCRPFRATPRPEEWAALLARLLELHWEHGINLVVIDPLSSLLPLRSENDATGMVEALSSLRRLTAAGLAVWLLHHPNKQHRADGHYARGSGALTAHVDIIIEMFYASRASDDDRRRLLRNYSRFDETPRRLVLELNAAGTDYLCHGDIHLEEFARNWQVLLAVLEDAKFKLTRQEIRAEWPADYPVPDAGNLWRWLDRALANGLILRDGTGRKNDPFRYWLPGQEAQWMKDPLHLLTRLQDDALKQALARLDRQNVEQEEE